MHLVIDVLPLGRVIQFILTKFCRDSKNCSVLVLFVLSFQVHLNDNHLQLVHEISYIVNFVILKIRIANPKPLHGLQNTRFRLIYIYILLVTKIGN